MPAHLGLGRVAAGQGKLGPCSDRKDRSQSRIVVKGDVRHWKGEGTMAFDPRDSRTLVQDYTKPTMATRWLGTHNRRMLAVHYQRRNRG